MSLVLVNRVAQLLQHVKPEISEADLLLIDVLGHVPAASMFFLRDNEDFEKDPKIWSNFFTYLASDRVPLMTIIRAVGAAAEQCPENLCGLNAGVRKYVCGDGLGRINAGMDFGTGVCLGLFLGATLNDNYGNNQNSDDFLVALPNIIRDLCVSNVPGYRLFQSPAQSGAAVNVIPPWVKYRLTRSRTPDDDAHQTRRLTEAVALGNRLASEVETHRLNSLGYLVLETLSNTISQIANGTEDAEDAAKDPK